MPSHIPISCGAIRRRVLLGNAERYNKLFDLTPFFFKASIVYLSNITFFCFIIFIIVIFSGGLNISVNAENNEKNTLNRVKYYRYWHQFPRLNKIIYGSVVLSVIIVSILAIYLENPFIGGDIAITQLILVITLIVGLLIKPFLNDNYWQFISITFIIFCTLFILVLAGYQDSKADLKDPKLVINNLSCPIIFATSEPLLGDV